MIFFKYKIDITETELFLEGREEAIDSMRAKGRHVREDYMAADYSGRAKNEVNEKFYYLFKTEKKCLAQIVDTACDRAEMAACHKIGEMTSEELDGMIVRTWDRCRILSREEITLTDFWRLMEKLEYGSWGGRSLSLREVENEFGLGIRDRGMFDRAPYEIEEKICGECDLTKRKCLEKAGTIMASEDFCEEIERIYSRENKRKYYGHPVHYLISAGDFGAAKDMIDILVPALLKNRRLLGARQVFLSKIEGKADRDERFEKVFSSTSGGTLIVRMPERSELGNMATDMMRILEAIGRMLEKYGNHTLFIFVDVSGKSVMAGEAMKTILTYADMIHLTEGSGSYRKAVRYLDRLARGTDYEDYRIEDVTAYLKEKDSYSVSDIFEAYNRWYADGLKSHVYRAYRKIDTYKIKYKRREDKPYETLMKMTGLAEVKDVVGQILDAAKVNNIRKMMGYQEEGKALHMLFYGNPGTAKTTVARLLAQILKEEGVLDNGHLVECGRQDLVGRYVGWTAKIVEEKFRAARGGVLFIDEAYSLVDGSNTYGAEAINTIVQQMENYREEIIVIFAGYPDKMKTFLEQNEGLNSRIAFHLHFPDYTGEELVEILDLMLEKRGYRIGEEAREKCLALCREACRYENFGNGRFVRNLLEQASMRQAARIMKTYEDREITREAASEMTAEDFAMPHMGGRKTERKIGFGAA